MNYEKINLLSIRKIAFIREICSKFKAFYMYVFFIDIFYTLDKS